MTLLLDPLVMSIERDRDGVNPVASEFWTRIVGWASDKRVKIGVESYNVILSEYGKYGYPGAELNLDGLSKVRREYQSALSKILSRVQEHSREPVELSFRADYVGGDEYRKALGMDISGTAGSDVHAVGTLPQYWGSVVEGVLKVDPSPPDAIELCYQPGASLRAEADRAIAEFFVGKRIHIVGGQVDNRIVSSLVSRFSLELNRVSWSPCEKAKPPRDLDKRWSALDSGRDVTVCVTGRVGHATSNAAAKVSRKCQVPHLIVELPSGIEQALLAHALTDL